MLLKAEQAAIHQLYRLIINVRWAHNLWKVPALWEKWKTFYDEGLRVLKIYTKYYLLFFS